MLYHVWSSRHLLSRLRLPPFQQKPRYTAAEPFVRLPTVHAHKLPRYIPYPEIQQPENPPPRPSTNEDIHGHNIKTTRINDKTANIPRTDQGLDIIYEVFEKKKKRQLRNGRKKRARRSRSHSVTNSSSEESVREKDRRGRRRSKRNRGR